MRRKFISVKVGQLLNSRRPQMTIFQHDHKHNNLSSGDGDPSGMTRKDTLSDLKVNFLSRESGARTGRSSSSSGTLNPSPSKSKLKQSDPIAASRSSMSAILFGDYCEHSLTL